LRDGDLVAHAVRPTALLDEAEHGGGHNSAVKDFAGEHTPGFAQKNLCDVVNCHSVTVNFLVAVRSAYSSTLPCVVVVPENPPDGRGWFLLSVAEFLAVLRMTARIKQMRGVRAFYGESVKSQQVFSGGVRF
jgi:hypothetical protein